MRDVYKRQPMEIGQERRRALKCLTKYPDL